jgi:hypothetical protein
MLTRSIDFDPVGLSIEEKIFSGAKRVCTVFAIAAATLTALDLANIGSVSSAAAVIHNNGWRVAGLPNQVRGGFQFISFTSDSPSVTVAIPRDPAR